MVWYFNLVCSLVLFFFSSRRRHTSSLRDWSSDVCSSDLRRRRWISCRDFWSPTLVTVQEFTTHTSAASSGRSEERRVGKECRTRGLPNHTKKYKTYNESS